MPEIEIRPAAPAELPILAAIDHTIVSSHVWQIDVVADVGQLTVRFREVRLPRPAKIAYPRTDQQLLQSWQDSTDTLVGVWDGRLVGYIAISERIAPMTAWVTDMAVEPAARRQGIAFALLQAAQDFACQRHNRRIILEMQSKNLPAIRLAKKMGYEFCGYNDHYYENQDIALFFGQFVR